MARKHQVNEEIAARVIPSDGKSLRQMRSDERRARPEEFSSVATKLAQSSFSNGNWKFKNADKHFPWDPVARRCQRYFPQAVGGPLLVDEPRDDREIALCEKKAEAILKEGQRYAYIIKFRFDQAKGETLPILDTEALAAARSRLADHDKRLAKLREAKAS